jgi:hypothetical protein
LFIAHESDVWFNDNNIKESADGGDKNKQKEGSDNKKPPKLRHYPWSFYRGHWNLNVEYNTETEEIPLSSNTSLTKKLSSSNSSSRNITLVEPTELEEVLLQIQQKHSLQQENVLNTKQGTMVTSVVDTSAC